VSRGTLFRENVAALASRGLTFDICVRSDQHALAAALIEACPQTQFILDHAGCPDIAGDVFTSWRESLGRLAEYDHLSVKISGLPTSCRPGEASAETLRPWVESVIELYGWERVVWGGDWPVCTLNGTLADWCAALDCILAEESADNCNRLYSENARRIYQL
jgi:predicted TIM-barrel fold metal-dependent hydrolase